MENNKEILPSQETLGQRLRLLRKKRGLSQKKLAIIAGYKGAVSISKIEKGLMFPSINALVKIAEALDADLHRLITGEPSPSEKRADHLRLQILRKLAKYISRGIAQLLGERESLEEELAEAEQKQAAGEDVEKEWIEQIKSEIVQVQSALSDFAKDQPWVRESLTEVEQYLKSKKSDQKKE